MGQIFIPGTADPGEVLSGQTFSAGTNYIATGTMVQRGAPTWTPGTSSISVPLGYYTGGTISAVSNLSAGNVLNGQTVGGVAGQALTGGSTLSGTARTSITKGRPTIKLSDGSFAQPASTTQPSYLTYTNTGFRGSATSSIIQLYGNTYLIASDTGSTATLRVAKITGGTITYSSSITVSPGAGYNGYTFLKLVRMSASTSVLLCTIAGATYPTSGLSAYVVTYNGTSITTGSEVLIQSPTSCGSAPNELQGVGIDELHLFAQVYYGTNSTNSGQAALVCLTVSGTSLSVGSTYSLDANTGTNGIMWNSSISPLSGGRFIWVYTMCTALSTYDTRAIVFSANANSIGYIGSAVSINSALWWYIDINNLEGDQCLVTGCNGSNNYIHYGVVLSISWITVTVGTVASYNPGSTYPLYSTQKARIATTPEDEAQATFIGMVGSDANTSVLYVKVDTLAKTVSFTKSSAIGFFSMSRNCCYLFSDSSGAPVWFGLIPSTFYIQPVRLFLPSTNATGVALADASAGSSVSSYVWGTIS